MSVCQHTIHSLHCSYTVARYAHPILPVFILGGGLRCTRSMSHYRILCDMDGPAVCTAEHCMQCMWNIWQIFKCPVRPKTYFVYTDCMYTPLRSGWPLLVPGEGHSPVSGLSLPHIPLSKRLERLWASFLIPWLLIPFLFNMTSCPTLTCRVSLWMVELVSGIFHWTNFVRFENIFCSKGMP